MKLKASNWSKAGALAGFILAAFSAWRYFVWYPDMDKAIIYPLIGILIIAVSWLYNKVLGQGNRIEEMGEYLADRNLERLEDESELEQEKKEVQTEKVQTEELNQKEVGDGNKSV